MQLLSRALVSLLSHLEMRFWRLLHHLIFYLVILSANKTAYVLVFLTDLFLFLIALTLLLSRGPTVFPHVSEADF